MCCFPAWLVVWCLMYMSCCNMCLICTKNSVCGIYNSIHSVCAMLQVWVFLWLLATVGSGRSPRAVYPPQYSPYVWVWCRPFPLYTPVLKCMASVGFWEKLFTDSINLQIFNVYIYVHFYNLVHTGYYLIFLMSFFAKLLFSSK